jgi:hypothetical protein
LKKLARLQKQNVRSFEVKSSPSSLSLESLRQVTGGGTYAHGGGGSVCVGDVIVID